MTFYSIIQFVVFITQLETSDLLSLLQVYNRRHRKLCHDPLSPVMLLQNHPRLKNEILHKLRCQNHRNQFDEFLFFCARTIAQTLSNLLLSILYQMKVIVLKVGLFMLTTIQLLQQLVYNCFKIQQLVLNLPNLFFLFYRQ